MSTAYWQPISDTYWMRLHGLNDRHRGYLSIREDHGWLVVRVSTGTDGHRQLGHAATLDDARTLALTDLNTPTD